jgi:hypothetical protein
MNILLVSETPVAGTVVRFNDALESYVNGATSFPFVLKNYKNSPFDLPYGQMSSLLDWPTILGNYTKAADHVIFHNCTNQSLIDLVKSFIRPSTTTSYHLHSAPFEAPLFGFDIITENNFDHIFSVAQGHQRFHKHSIGIANIIPDIKIFDGSRKRQSALIGHLRTTSARWSKKIPPQTLETLEPLLKKQNVELTTIKSLFNSDSVPYQTFVQSVQSFNYVIDDVCSGLFHQLSLEGLKSGCIVFSAADEYSLDSFSKAAQSPTPPFDIVSSLDEIYEKIKYYENNPAKLVKKQLENLTYATEYLSERRVAKIAASEIKKAIMH